MFEAIGIKKQIPLLLSWQNAASKFISTIAFHLPDIEWISDIDILSFYLSGLKPLKVHSFGSLSHFKKSKKPIEAGDAISCLDCPYESQCAWSAKKIYLETLGREVKQVSIVLMA